MSKSLRAWWGLVFIAACSPTPRQDVPTRAVGALPFVVGAHGFEHGGINLGRSARDAIEVRLDVPATTVTLRALDVDDARGALVDGAVVYRRVHAAEDAIVTAGPNGFEERRVLHTHRDAFAERISLQYDHALLSVRVRERRLELVERSGRVAFATDPAWCQDADGVRRDVSVSLDGDTATFAVTLAGLAPPIVVDPVWTTVPSMAIPHRIAGVTRLKDGKILVAGGMNTGYLSEAEIYDPTLNTWSAADPMPGVGFAKLLTLPSGKVLACGLEGGMPALFEPTTRKWTSLTAAPWNCGGALLSSKVGTKAVVFSGARVAVYDDAANTWTVGADNPKKVGGSGTITLADGRILFVGGNDGLRNFTTSQLYDPATNTWTNSGDIFFPRFASRLYTLSSGKILSMGGWSGVGNIISSVELYDPTTGTWSKEPDAPMGNDYSFAMGTDHVFTARSDGTYDVYDAVGKRWTSLPASSPGRGAFGFVALDATHALAFGGEIIPGYAITNTVAKLTLSPNGTTCTAANAGECASTQCQSTGTAYVCCESACDGPCQQCDSTGTCKSITGTPPRSATACAPYAGCSAGACIASCTTSAQCASTAYCLGTTCVPKKANGTACGDAGECTSGFCADGVCCNVACTGQCAACDLSGDGTCRAVSGKPRGARPACADDGKECGTVCNGTDRTKCNYLPAGTVPCGVNACSAGVETHASTCDGAGKCGDPPKSCGGYKCGSVACRSACGSKLDCADGYICSGGACIAAPGLGTACTDGSGCATENCVDGVCCASASCGAGSTCAAPGKEGRCTKKNGLSCAAADECASGLCVDGHCCESECKGQCESCAVPGQVGKCTAVVGAPRAREACKTDSADACSAHLCDGKDRSTCAGFVGADVECRPASCKDGVATEPASCAGSGACPAAVTSECGAYRCDADGKRCLLACSGDEGCASKYKCVAGTCRPSGDTCDETGTSAIFSDGTKRACLPYRCQAGSCLGQCATTDDCAGGYVCDGNKCVQAVPPAEESGGCSHSAGAPSGGAFALLALALFALRRRPLKLAPFVLLACTSSPSSAPTAKTRAALYAWTTGSDTNTNHPGGYGGLFPLPGGDVAAVTYGYADERWSSTTGKWTSIGGSFQTSGTNAAAIAPGKLVIAGGNVSEVSHAVLYEPAIPKTTPLADMPHGHGQGAIVAWLGAPVSRYLIAGGSDTSTNKFTDLYDPTTNTWSSAPNTPTVRNSAAVVSLSGGRVLAIGGFNEVSSGYTSAVEMFDGSTKTWSAKASLPSTRFGAAAVELSSGKVLLVGGFGPPMLYDPVANTWTSAGTGYTQNNITAVLLPSDRVLVAGGTGSSAVAVWNPTTSTMVPASSLPHELNGGVGLHLGAGRVMITGGAAGFVGWNLATDFFQQQANGATCGANGDCTSLLCVDGVCCDTACNGSCQACNLTGKVGTCSPVTGAVPAGHPSCSPYVSCNAGACASSCTADSACASGAFCNGSACENKRANGAACTENKQCTSGACADGYCCNVACTGQCEACNVAGFLGACKPVSGAPRGTRPACEGDGSTCAPKCNGVDTKACVFPPASTSCGSNACTAGVETHARTCDGVGHCGDVPKTCGAFACSGTVCKTTCTTNSDCAAGFVCNSSSACVPAPGLGQACSSTKPCSGSLFCTDGVCCGVASCGAGKSCALAAHKGECSVVDGTTCASDGECGSGNCVDGVCCETTCDGQCQACDVAGSLGKCVPVKGKPHGKRIACGESKDHPCESTSCDGSDGSSCVALAGADVTCRAARCADGVASSAGTCDGKGVCSAATTTACSPYGCAADGVACATKCDKADDCAPGFLCVANACVKPFSRCSEDRRSLVDAEGKATSCAPLMCKDGACLEKCTTTDECVPGTACADGQCVPIAVDIPPSDEGGCSYGHASRGAPLALLLSMLLLRRRR